MQRLRERLRNYPGRAAVNAALKRFRRRAIGLLPSTEGRWTGLVEAAPSDRWAPLDPARYRCIEGRLHEDRPTRRERLRRFDGDLTIDPYSMHLFDDRRLIAGSTDAIAAREREPRPAGWLLGPQRRFEEVVVLRGSFDANYFHFLFDTMMKLMLVDAHVPSRIPLLISRSLATSRFFTDAAAAGLFGNREIIVQGPKERIGAAAAWVVTPREPTADDFLRLAAIFGAPVPDETSTMKLYVARGSGAANARRLRNQEQLYGALAERGFVFFDPQEHALAEQIATFSRARVIVSPHGAGVTNTIWRQGAPTTVVELVNRSMHSFDMVYISAVLGYRHELVFNKGDTGQPLRSSADADIPRLVALLDEIEGRDRAS